MSHNSEDDDAYSKFQCHGNFWGENHVHIFYVDGGNLLLGITRFFAFFMFICLQYYNRTLLRQKKDNDVSIIRGLVLPSYLPVLYFYTLFSVVFGIIDVIISSTLSNSSEINSYLYPAEVAFTHVLLEGIAFFLMRHGAGVQAIRSAFKISLCWGVITFGWFFLIFSFLYDRFGLNKDRDRNITYGLFVAYESVLLIFYLAYGFIPAKYLYHRPALTFYARFNALSFIVVIIFATLFHEYIFGVVCPGTVIAFIFASFLQPLAIFKTLQIDSQYWQGLSPEAGNPLTEVWDHLGIETATSMAENLERLGNSNEVKLPILHFGLMEFDDDLQFVAGGFSRVYFGNLRNQRVAFKILFAMELDANDVKEFYREASVLHRLKHPNIVKCLGVCVMPPALTIVLELCSNGSLFDFLYKPAPAVAGQTNRVSMTQMIRNSLVGTRFRPSEIELRPSAVFGNNRRSSGGAGAGLRSSEGIAEESGRDSDLEDQAAVNPLNMNYGAHSGQGHSGGTASSTSGMGASGDGRTAVLPSTDSQKNRTISVRTLGAILTAPFSGGAFGGGGGGMRGSDGSDLRGSTASVTMRPPLGSNLTFDRRLRMMSDAAGAIDFLHRAGYMHCDIKSLNFLVTENYVLKLADMGEARRLDDPPKRDRPPIPARNWAPPEVLEADAIAESYTIASDIYGLCIVLSEILTAELPFGSKPDLVSQNAWHSLLTQEGLRPDLPADLPVPLRKVIEAGWDTEPSTRPRAEAILAVIEEYVSVGRSSAGSSNQ